MVLGESDWAMMAFIKAILHVKQFCCPSFCEVTEVKSLLPVVMIVDIFLLILIEFR
jgi:hypothetical protein